MPDQEPAVVESGENRHTRERYFMRFTRAQRYLHAVMFTTFLGLAATGLPMRFSDSIACTCCAIASIDLRTYSCGSEQRRAIASASVMPFGT